MAASSTPYPVHEASGSTQSASRTWTNPTRMMKTLELGMYLWSRTLSSVETNANMTALPRAYSTQIIVGD